VPVPPGRSGGQVVHGQVSLEVVTTLLPITASNDPDGSSNSSMARARTGAVGDAADLGSLGRHLEDARPTRRCRRRRRPAGQVDGQHPAPGADLEDALAGQRSELVDGEGQVVDVLAGVERDPVAWTRTPRRHLGQELLRHGV
jgi:hypothetical protein